MKNGYICVILSYSHDFTTITYLTGTSFNNKMDERIDNNILVKRNCDKLSILNCFILTINTVVYSFNPDKECFLMLHVLSLP